MSDFDKDWIKKKLDGKLEDGIYVRKTWDIRVVENFFKRLFGKKKKEKKDDKGREKKDK